MIIQESSINKFNNILDRLPVLYELNNPKSVTIIETSKGDMVRFADLYNYAQKAEITFHEALNDIENYNNMYNLQIGIDEALIYDYPNLLNEFDNLLIMPQSKNSLAYKFCELCLEAYLETGNKDYIDYFLEAEVADAKNATGINTPAQNQSQPSNTTPTTQSTGQPSASQPPAVNTNTTPQTQTPPAQNQGQPSNTTPTTQSTGQPSASQPPAVNTNTTPQTQTSPAQAQGQQSQTQQPRQSESQTNSSPNTTNKEPSWLAKKYNALKDLLAKHGIKDIKSFWEFIRKKMPNFNNNNLPNKNTTKVNESSLNPMLMIHELTKTKTPISPKGNPPPKKLGVPTFPSNPNPAAPTVFSVPRKSSNNQKDPESTQSSQVINDPKTTDPTKIKLQIEKPPVNIGGKNHRQEIKEDIGLFINEVYRPRRLYRHRYLR